MILSRKQFIKWWNNHAKSRCDAADHPMWIPETDIKPGPPAQWFVRWPLDHDAWYKNITNNYWEWCDTMMSGPYRCYMVNEAQGYEWWGFTNKDDLLLWSLKWA